MASQKQLEAWDNELNKMMKSAFRGTKGAPTEYSGLPGVQEILKEEPITREHVERIAAIVLEQARKWEPVRKLEVFESGGDGSHGGISDLYPENEKALREALGEGGPFTTGWWASKKELWSAIVTRAERGGPVSIQASACMDDGADLLDSAIWEAAGGNKFAGSGYAVLEKLGVKDPDGFIENALRDQEEAGNIFAEDNCEGGSRELPPNCSYDDVTDALDALMDVLEADLHTRYGYVVNAMKDDLELLRKKKRKS